MLLENQTINVKVTNMTEIYFKEKGYNVKNGDKINIPIEELPSGSGLKALVMCDYCGSIFEKQWRKILISKDDCCKNCKTKKMMRTSLKKYGTVCSLHNPIIEEKVKRNNLKKIWSRVSITKQRNSSKDKKEYRRKVIF